MKSIVILAFQLSPLSLSSGLKWRDATREVSSKPPWGQELRNTKLATELEKTKTEFTEDELAEFNIDDLHSDVFIKVGDSYFKPAQSLGLRLGLKWEQAELSSPDRQPLRNDELATELAKNKTEFTVDQWAKFKIGDLRSDDFIKVGNRYFKPSPKNEQELDASIKTEEELKKYLEILRRCCAIYTKKKKEEKDKHESMQTEESSVDASLSSRRYREYLNNEQIICRHLIERLDDIQKDDQGQLVEDVFERQPTLAEAFKVPAKHLQSWTRHICQILGDLVAIRDSVPRSQLKFTLDLVHQNAKTFEVWGAHRGPDALINQSSHPPDRDKIAQRLVAAHEHITQKKFNERSYHLVKTMQCNKEIETHEVLWYKDFYDSDGEEEDGDDNGAGRSSAKMLNEFRHSKSGDRDDEQLVVEESKRVVNLADEEEKQEIYDDDELDRPLLSEMTHLGLKWQKSGSARPTQGRELKSDNLTNLLKGKTEFSEDEWASCGIGDLRSDDFIKADDCYFKPAAVGEHALFPTQPGYGAPVLSKFCVTSVYTDHVPVYHVQVLPYDCNPSVIGSVAYVKGIDLG